MNNRLISLVICALSVLLLFPGVYAKAGRLQFVSDLLSIPINYFVYSLLFSLVVVYMILVRRNLYAQKSTAIIFLFTTLLLLWIAVSYVWSIQTSYAQSKLLRIIVFYFPYLICGFIVSITEREYTFHILISLFSLWVAIEVLYSIVFLQFPYSIAINGSYILIARAIGFSIPLLLSLLVVASSKRQKLSVAFCIIFLFVMLMNTGARGPFISCLISVVPIIIIEMINIETIQQKLLDIRTVVIAAFIFLVSIFYFFNTKVMRRFINSDVDTRTQLVFESLRLWSESPIYGHGIGSYEKLTATHVQYPHNILLELLVELGSIGFILFASVIIIVSLRAFRVCMHSNNPVYSGTFGLFVFMFCNSLVSFDLNGNRQLLFVIGLMIPTMYTNTFTPSSDSNEPE